MITLQIYICIDVVTCDELGKRSTSYADIWRPYTYPISDLHDLLRSKLHACNEAVREELEISERLLKEKWLHQVRKAFSTFTG